MESYVERWKREQEQKKAAAEKKERRKAQKAQKGQTVQKEVKKDGTDSRGEGHETQTESSGRE